MGQGVECVPSLTSILSFVCGGIPKVAGTKVSGCSLNPNSRVGLVSCNLRASVCDMHSVAGGWPQEWVLMVEPSLPCWLPFSNLGRLGSLSIPGKRGRNDRTCLPSPFSPAIFWVFPKGDKNSDGRGRGRRV